MKKLLLILCFILLIPKVTAANNPYKEAGPYGTNCTWYAWQMAYEKAGVALPGWSNAKNWYNDAQNSGYTVGKTPKANSIIVWGGWTSYGHVGYVEKVSGNTLYIWDSSSSCIDENSATYQECIANSYCEQTDRECRQNAPKIACEYTISPDKYGITGYIYLTKTPTKSTPTVKKEEVKETVKSNNANLSSLEISDIDITFDKNTLEYNVEISNKIDKVTVKATSEDDKAKVEYNEEYELKAGINEIKITVKAEDETVKEYKIFINKPLKEPSPREELKIDYTPLIIVSIIDLIIILLAIIIWKRGRKNVIKKSNRTSKKI